MGPRLLRQRPEKLVRHRRRHICGPRECRSGPTGKIRRRFLDGGGRRGLISAGQTMKSFSGTPELALDHEPAPRISWAGCASCMSGAPASLTQSAYSPDTKAFRRTNDASIGICSAEKVADGQESMIELAVDRELNKTDDRLLPHSDLPFRRPVTWTLGEVGWKHCFSDLGWAANRTSASASS